MAWEENSRICLHMQLIAILSQTGVTICFSCYYNRSPNTKSLDLKYLEAIEEMLNFASVTNVLQNMKIRISLMGRLANQPIGT